MRVSIRASSWTISRVSSVLPSSDTMTSKRSYFWVEQVRSVCSRYFRRFLQGMITVNRGGSLLVPTFIRQSSWPGIAGLLSTKGDNNQPALSYEIKLTGRARTHRQGCREKQTQT